MIAIIPARKGSQGLPGKNTRKLAGKPLIQWSIEQAQAAGIFSKIVVNSDDTECHKIAVDLGVTPYARPEYLCGGDVLIQDVILEQLKSTNDSSDSVCLLNPTSPLRTPVDIVVTAKKLTGIYNTSLTVTQIRPVIMTRANLRGANVYHMGRTAVLNRQRRGPVLVQNGAVYCVWSQFLRESSSLIGGRCNLHIMPKERSVDIDDIWDFRVAEAYLRERGIC